MKANIPIGITPGTRIIRIERVLREGWKLWIHANPACTEGTYIMMYDDGRMERITLYPDGTETLPLVIKEGDK